MPEIATGVLCMAYGSPRSAAEIEPYYTHIRRGRKPSPALLAELTGRYRAIGGSPLGEITAAQARLLGEALGIPAFVGNKHSPPFVADGAREAWDAGIRRLIGLVLAPHYSSLSLGEYEGYLRPAFPGEVEFVTGFHDHPAFIDAVCNLLREAMSGWRPELLLFTAHSLPERILAAGDPYVAQLDESCRLVAARMELPPWDFAFQSRSATGEPWLGPDILDAIAASGAGTVLVCPIGFTADHLEILYDLDVETQQFARERGLEVRRTESFNTRPDFIAALAAVVRDRALTAPGPPSGARAEQ